ncbi:MAG TPA: peptidase E [Candidatus Limnocylindrales bacterium]|nr:peptidase E [Candidatus Limnocylindrales bacterium]
MAEPRIVAFGGASLLPSSNDGALHRWLLDLTGIERPRICFLGTAGGDDPADLANFYAVYAQLAEASHLGLFDRQIADTEAHLLAQDVIYVGGGNTANLLAIWRVHGVDVALRRAWDSGVILAGTSAGALCWFDSGLTDSFGPGLSPLKDGLRFLKGSFCPHYDSESLRRPRYHEVIGSGALPDGYAVDDGVGLLFAGRELAEAVAVLPETRAFRVERRRGNDVEEIPIRPRILRG